VAPDRPAASPTIDIAALSRAARRLADPTTRLIGWGTGSAFDYFARRHPLPLAYLVDRDATRWGTTRHGVPIEPPDRLRSEDPDRTFIVIYSSFWPDIQQALARLGPFASLAASAVFVEPAALALLARAEAWAAAPPRRPAAKDRAIVIQGPVVPEYTPLVVRALSGGYPDARLILSTWADTPAPDLAGLAPWVDELVTSRRPGRAGVQNRNLQIVSTRAGLARAKATGARTILKTRTDLAVLRDGLFDDARTWIDDPDASAPRTWGQAGRILIPSTFTRKYLLYHPSDLVMLGAADDLERYWDVPLDPRPGDLLAPELRDLSLLSLNMNGHPAESYLGLSFCRRVGRRPLATLEDSWAFYRDFFAVMDNDWFGLLWLKHLSIPDAGIRSGPRTTVSHAFWRSLRDRAGAAGPPGADAAEMVRSVDPAGVDPATTPFATLIGLAS
jgi:hypothetical protein